jgi:kynureninase
LARLLGVRARWERWCLRICINRPETLPVDIHALGVDFATGGSVKWLCGGPGAGYLYVRPDLLRQLRPAARGWMAHRQPFEFEPGPIYYAEDEFRFLNGTPGIPSLYSARSGY